MQRQQFIEVLNFKQCLSDQLFPVPSLLTVSTPVVKVAWHGNGSNLNGSQRGANTVDKQMNEFIYFDQQNIQPPVILKKKKDESGWPKGLRL